MSRILRQDNVFEGSKVFPGDSGRQADSEAVEITGFPKGFVAEKWRLDTRCSLLDTGWGALSVLRKAPSKAWLVLVN
jgi:hypothetical protein